MRLSPNVIPSPRVAGETERGDPAAAILDIAALCGGVGIPYRVTGGCPPLVHVGRFGRHARAR